MFLPPQVSEERLGRVLKETQQQYEREISQMQRTSFILPLCGCVWQRRFGCPEIFEMTAASPPHPDSLSQRKEPPRCRKECPEIVGKLQKKNQELQRHLEKACRQLQHVVQEHQSAVQKLKGI